MSKPFLDIQALAKRYPQRDGNPGPPVFDEVSFGIERGQFVCVIGHSGCGKTTILNILAGIDHASEGVVIMDGREIDGPSLERGVVFQAHALLPWLTALQKRRLRRAFALARVQPRQSARAQRALSRDGRFGTRTGQETQ
jgi:nitrate/nitrite transport system ATP-binding protein